MCSIHFPKLQYPLDKVRKLKRNELHCTQKAYIQYIAALGIYVICHFLCPCYSKNEKTEHPEEEKSDVYEGNPLVKTPRTKGG